MTMPDVITITGPHDVPDYWVDDYVDEETGVLVPGHVVDMSDVFRLTGETLGTCGHVHGYTSLGSKSAIIAYPEFVNATVTELKRQVQRAIDTCLGETTSP